MAAVNDPTAAFQTEGGADAKPVDIDLTKLTALSPEVIMNQATVSIAICAFACSVANVQEVGRLRDRKSLS
jgi:hypothetical protein